MEKSFGFHGKKMPIKEYEEKKIRNQIINKIKPVLRKGRSKHQKGYIYLNKKVEAKVKIPNNHDSIMKPSKTQYIASALKLKDDEFNNLIDCPLTGPKYYSILKKLVEKQES